MKLTLGPRTLESRLDRAGIIRSVLIGQILAADGSNAFRFRGGQYVPAGGLTARGTRGQGC